MLLPSGDQLGWKASAAAMRLGVMFAVSFWTYSPPKAVKATLPPSGDWRGACTTRTRTGPVSSVCRTRVSGPRPSCTGAVKGMSLILPDAMSSRLIPPPTLISIALSPGMKLKRGSRSA